MTGKYSHIGIVAVSGPGAALCYQTIVTEFEELTGRRYEHPEVSMHSHSFKEYMDKIETGDWTSVASLLLDSARKLALIGADFAVCPDNTVHIAYDYVAKESPIPWMHIAEEVAKEAVEQGYRKLAILGTKYLMESNVYPSKLKEHGLEWVIPNGEERQVINQVIFGELVYGAIKQESRKKLANIIKRLAEEGEADAAVLGCTELPLILDNNTSPIPVLDSTRILARRAMRRALKGKP